MYLKKSSVLFVDVDDIGIYVSFYLQTTIWNKDVTIRKWNTWVSFIWKYVFFYNKIKIIIININLWLHKTNILFVINELECKCFFFLLLSSVFFFLIFYSIFNSKFLSIVSVCFLDFCCSLLFRDKINYFGLCSNEMISNFCSFSGHIFIGWRPMQKAHDVMLCVNFHCFVVRCCRPIRIQFVCSFGISPNKKYRSICDRWIYGLVW